jgi:hypothetical protein
MERIIAVITDAETSRAKFGTVEFSPEDCQGPDPQAPLAKKPEESADPHHPAVPTLLTIGEGSHSIFVPAADGRSEIECRLEKGDRILFLDFKPVCQPEANRRFCYAGHWSRSGPEGALLLRISFAAVDFEKLCWVDGLPPKED